MEVINPNGSSEFIGAKRGVIFASGGFSQNKQMLEEWVRPKGEDLLQRTGKE